MRLSKTAILAAGLALLSGSALADGVAGNSAGLGVVPKPAVPETHPRMTSDFSSLVGELKGASVADRKALMQQDGANRTTPLLRLKGERLDAIESYVWLESWDDEVREAVAAAGAEITGEDESRYLLQAWIPLNKVDSVAGVKGVRHLRRPSYGYASAGSVVTEGDANLGTTFVRSIGGLDGSGIKVGVLSQGLFNRSYSSAGPASSGTNTDRRVQSGNLPPYGGDAGTAGPRSGFLGAVDIDPNSFTLHEFSAEPSEYDSNMVPEGAAILEIVHDLAPAAELFFGGVDTDIDLRIRRDFLLGKGVDVIVDDMVFYDSGRFDGTSAISRRAQDIVLNEDVVYVVAAGNQVPLPEVLARRDIWTSQLRFPLFINGFFSALPGFADTKFHNFASGYAPSQTDRELTVGPVNGVLDVVLVWDDTWDDQNPSASIDYDLYLYGYQGIESGDVISVSANVQNGNGLPIERLTTTAAGGRSSLVISRKRYTGRGSTLFALVILQGVVYSEDTPYLTHGLPGNNGDALPPVITVGSIDATQGISRVDDTTVPGRWPGFGRSHDGSFVKWFTTQESPAVVSYTNVWTQSTPVLTGSSAAAAHIGGLTALLRHGYRDIPSFEFYSIYRTLGEGAFPNATLLETARLSNFANAPDYYRVNGFDTFLNIEEARMKGTAKRSAYVATAGEALGDWTTNTRDAFNEPVFGSVAQGLTLSPGGQDNVFGFWETPLLQFQTTEGESSRALRTDRLYEVTVRVGTDEPDPLLVPDFRLRLLTGKADEAALLVVNGANDVNTPSSIGGVEYTMYYRPSNPAIAEQGMRFAFDLIHFNEEDNANATLYLQELSVKELLAP